MWYKTSMTPAPRIGTEFAGYRIEGLLGRGGMGVVYRAEHPRLGATIALKVMDPELAMNEAFRERFVREARAAARIKHPNIIPIYDAGEWHGDLYIAMRYIEGDDLKSVLGKDGALPAERNVRDRPADRERSRRRTSKRADPSRRQAGEHPRSSRVRTPTRPIAYLADLGLTKHVDSHSGGDGKRRAARDDRLHRSRADQRVAGRRPGGRLLPRLRPLRVPHGLGPLREREPGGRALGAPARRGAHGDERQPSLSPAVDAALARGMAKSPDDRFSTAREPTLLPPMHHNSKRKRGTHPAGAGDSDSKRSPTKSGGVP